MIKTNVCVHVGSLTQVQKIGEKCSAKTFFLPDFCLFLVGVFKLQTCLLYCVKNTLITQQQLI